MYKKGGFLIKTILKNILCQIIWYLIKPYLFCFVPFPIIKNFLEKIFYKYIYYPTFDLFFDKTLEIIYYLYNAIKNQLQYILKRLY